MGRNVKALIFFSGCNFRKGKDLSFAGMVIHNQVGGF